MKLNEAQRQNTAFKGFAIRHGKHFGAVQGPQHKIFQEGTEIQLRQTAENAMDVFENGQKVKAETKILSEGENDNLMEIIPISDKVALEFQQIEDNNSRQAFMLDLYKKIVKGE